MEPSSPLFTRRRGSSGYLQIKLDENDVVHADFYSLAAKNHMSQVPTTLVIVPGNPGATDFYTVFVDALHDACKGKYHIVVSYVSAPPYLSLLIPQNVIRRFCASFGQTGHGSPALNGSRLFTVEDQIKHKIAFLRSYLKGEYNEALFGETTKEPLPTSHKLVLMGHSIGAFMSLKVRGRATDLPIIGVVGMMPTLRHLWQGFNLFVKVITTWPFRDILSYFGHWFPLQIAHLAARFGTDAEFSHQLDGVLRNKLSYYTLNNILNMAHIEGRDIYEIDSELTEELNKNGNTTLLLYSSRDKYTPKPFIDDMRKEFPLVHVYMSGDEVEHAFVTRAAHARETAQQLEYLMRLIELPLDGGKKK